MYKLLIAEDEPEMRNLLVKYIRQKEKEIEVVGSVENGAQALALAVEKQPDIILTDIFMPVMNGLELLKEITKRGMNVKMVIISGYDEFEYAKEAISLGVSNYLLKPFDPVELEGVLGKIKTELDSQRILVANMKLLREQATGNDAFIKEKLLRDLLSGKTEGIESRVSEFFGAETDYFCTCLLKLPIYQPAGEWCLDEQENIDELVKLMCGGYLHRDIKVHGLAFEKNSAILILSGRASGKQQFLYKVKGGMEHLQKSMDRYYHIRLVCVVGGIYEHWSQLKTSYQEAMNVWKGLLSTERPIIVCGEESSQPAVGVVDSSKKIKRLKEQIILAVRMGQEKEYTEYLEALVQIYASIAPGKTDFVSISAEELMYGIFNEIEENGLRLDETRSNEEIQREMKQQINSASLLEIKELLEKYFHMCRKSFLGRQNKEQSEVIVEHVKALIENHLEDEELSLEWIAEKVHFSQAYVRQIFKQKTGERLTEYMIRKRMEKAGRLLLKTNMKIQDIAASCGYSNQRYFASSFKKYYDCTPTDFKMMMGNEEN